MNLSYRIVQGSSIGEVEVQVSEFMNDGWVLNGPHRIDRIKDHSIVYSQSIYWPLSSTPPSYMK